MITVMVDLIVEILGEYVPLNGEGIATLNWPWLVGAIIWILIIWFIFKLILRLIQGSGRSVR